MKAALYILSAVVAATGLVLGPHLVFGHAPIDEQLYFNQKIFYYHVPVALTMFIAVFVSGIASVMWLRTRNPSWDDVAWSAADLVVLFGLTALVTGSIWARIAWGRWWVWEARLMNTMLLWMIFLAYALVRRYGGPGSERLGAGLAIFGMVDVPLVYFAVNLWKTMHPSNTVVPGLRGAMAVTFLATMVTFVFLFVVLLRAWVAARRNDRRIDDVTDLAIEAGRIE